MIELDHGILKQEKMYYIWDRGDCFRHFLVFGFILRTRQERCRGLTRSIREEEKATNPKAVIWQNKMLANSSDCRFRIAPCYIRGIARVLV